MKPTIIACAAGAMLITACGAGGGALNSPQPNATTPGSVSMQPVSGTLTIGNPGSTASSNARGTASVSVGTGHVALFIDGASATAGQTSTCSGTRGVGTGCTITWAAQLTVPASHVFAIEADSGPSNLPNNTVLSVGSGSYAIVAGSANALAALSLNGIATQTYNTVSGCSGISPNSFCMGLFAAYDATGYAIKYDGTTPVPTVGNSPTSGNVFDNGPLTYVSSAPAIGVITGTAQPTFSSLTAGTLTASGVTPSGTSYTYQVTCAAGVTGTFGITFGGGANADTVVTAAELAGLTPPVSLPALGVIALLTGQVPPSFTCTNGNITSAGGMLTVN